MDLKKIKEVVIGKHYVMERLAVEVLSLSMIMIILISASFITYQKNKKITLSDNPIYTSTFTTSITGNSGSVVNVYRNKDYSKAFVLLKFNSMETLSTDANNYQMYLSAAQEKMKMNPSGNIMLFGSTGYMGLYFVNDEPFKKQLLDITVRHNGRFTKGSGEETSSSDSSFSKYDQFQVFVNLGATNAVHAKFLDNIGNITPGDVYAEVVSSTDESENRENLNNELFDMGESLAKINEYENRLVNLDIAVPDRPDVMKGDKVTKNGDMYYLSSSYTFPGGVDFNWQDTNIEKGYIDNLCGDMTYKDYLNKLKSENVTDDSDTTDYAPDVFYYSDGTEIEFDTQSNVVLADETNIQNTINDYKSGIETYINQKRTYQTASLVSLLELEANSKLTFEDFTMNTSDNVLTVWSKK